MDVAVARCFLLLLLKSIETDDLIVSLYDLLTFVIACLNCMTSVIACVGVKFNNKKSKNKKVRDAKLTPLGKFRVCIDAFISFIETTP